MHSLKGPTSSRWAPRRRVPARTRYIRAIPTQQLPHEHPATTDVPKMPAARAISRAFHLQGDAISHCLASKKINEAERRVSRGSATCAPSSRGVSRQQQRRPLCMIMRWAPD